jgi:hypothetical protein
MIIQPQIYTVITLMANSLKPTTQYELHSHDEKVQ